MTEDEKQAESFRRKAWTWVIVGGCAVTVAAAFGLSAITAVKQSQADTARNADKKAQSIAQVAQCFAQVKNAPAVLGALNVIDLLATNSIKANRAALKTAKPGDPLRTRAEASLARVIPGRAGLRRLIARSKAKFPKKAACFAMAKQAGVDPSKLKQ